MTENALTQVETITLVALTDRPRYGYELVQRIAELTAGRISVRPGNLYRVLHRLEQSGLVRERAAARGAAEDERRRYFALTAAGRRAAATELEMYRLVLQRSSALLEEGGHV